MKKLLFILMITSSASAQLQSGIGLGYGTHLKSQVFFGYDVGKFNLTGELRPSLSRDVSAHNYMGGNLSYNLGDPTTLGAYFLGLGYYYDRESSDKVSLNRSYPAVSFRYVRQINYQGFIYSQVLYLNKSVEVTFGMILKFVR